MKKNLSYRDKLLELGRIYKITEIQNYIKRKKNLWFSYSRKQNEFKKEKKDAICKKELQEC